MVDKVETATELVTTEADVIVDTAVVAPVEPDELSSKVEDLVGMEIVGKLGDVTDVVVVTLASS